MKEPQQQQQQQPRPSAEAGSTNNQDDHTTSSNCIMMMTNNDDDLRPSLPLTQNNHNLHNNNNPIVLLEHININVGSDFFTSDEKFFFHTLQCRLDTRTSQILSTMQNAGGKATKLWWANIGYQQFHLVGYDNPNAYHKHLGNNEHSCCWSSKQIIHGNIGLEWPNNVESWKILNERLHQALNEGCIQQYDEIITIIDDDDDDDPKEENSLANTPTKYEKENGSQQQHANKFFRVVACNGNIFQIHPQQQPPKCLLLDGSNDDNDNNNNNNDDDCWYFIGPTWPVPLVRNHPIPLPMSNSSFCSNQYNVDITNPCVLGMRFVEYYVPPPPPPTNNLNTINDGKNNQQSSSSLDIIRDSYQKIFPGLIYSYQKVPYWDNITNSNSQQRLRQFRDCLQIMIGHCNNPQYIRYIQLRAHDTQRNYDGHHLAIYINDFVKSYQNAKRHNMVYENPVFPQFYYTTLEDALKFNEFRIRDFTFQGQIIFQLEHEIRSLNHSGYTINQHVWQQQQQQQQQ